MKKFLKFLLIVFIWLLISVAIIGGGLLAGLELNVSLIILGSIFVGWIAFLLIRKIVINYRAKKKVEGLISVEESEKSSSNFNFSFAKTPLTNNFVSMTKLLKKSYLKVHGDPMYVLPWYLMIGKNGSGKTELLKNANLLSPTIDKKSLINTDCGLNWCLYNQAIILDTPGEFLATDSAANRNGEWLELLGLLKKHRPKEPVNGVIVTLSMDDLLADNSQKLIELGIEARKSIEQLMQQLHVQVPVYVIVTQTDKLAGVEEWVSSLNRELLTSPIGEINNDDLPVLNFIHEAVSNISERLKQLLLSAIREDSVSASLLLLPTKLEKIERHIATFSESLFQTNPYQKTPFFRGIYFVGDGANTKHELVGKEKGIFSNKIFTEIIPNERDMISSLISSEKVARTKRLGKTFAWNATFAAVIFSLYYIYNSDVSTLDKVINENAGNFEESAELPSNISAMYKYRSMVNSLQSNAWVPWFGLSGTPEFIGKLEGMFAERVQARLVEKTDQVFVKELANIFTRDTDVSEEKIVAYISTLVRRINIIDAYMDGESNDTLATMPAPYSYSDADFFGIQDSSVVDQLNTLYLQSLAWSTDKAMLRQEVLFLDEQLNDILVKSKDLAKWLIPWANKVAKSSEVRLSDYWSVGTGAINEDTIIAGAYTVKGKEVIDDFITQIKATQRYDDFLAKILPGFEEQYKKIYFDNWEHFAETFDNGSQKLNNRSEWLTIVNNLATGRNLFFNAMQLVSDQIAPYKDDPQLPAWGGLLFFYQEMLAYAPEEKTDGNSKMINKMALKLVGKAGPLGKALAKSGKKGLKAKKKMNKGGGPTVDERQMRLEEAGKLLGDYRLALTNFVYSAEVRSVSYDAISGLYMNPDNPAEGESNLSMAYTSLKKLQAIIGKENNENESFWKLYSGGIHFMQDYMMSESSCKLQDTWTNEFLTNLEGVAEYKLPGLAFGAEGLLWPFLENQLAPFVSERFGAGYVASKVGQIPYPISSEFLEFAARAKDGKQAKQAVYPVHLATLPSSTNLDSKYVIKETSIEMQCASGSTALVNKNFANSELFEWTESCSKVNLVINIGRFRLEHAYDGELGFPNFLADFKTGQKRFTPDDFPRESDRLREAGISFMDIKYRIDGQNSLLQALKSKQIAIPREIAGCWPDNQSSLSASIVQ
ncbi:hypothetical protein H4J59_01815 [Colwellia sp. MB02u-10]|uniref:type VI secretion protein IcmF/TssM N-terminal domain-containing protein n=1 Tax=Colwellia sp. MB02u-10 TaxID=2759828 RepID=UPI0015F62121|nr:type VI secretion protein IcmF/TssM N-terminal domain-containing protein [Colwellia sp. MB02u-10]MBA6339751.1 hypothetical protein [Colwellia sp. MB02u-10]